MSEHGSDRLRVGLFVVGGVVAVSMLAAVVAVRMTTGRRVADPAGDRVQALLDETNRLLKNLENRQHELPRHQEG